MDSPRKKILDKAKKLKELADRGVGGEKENAIRMLDAYMQKHNISDSEISSHKLDDRIFSGYTKEQIYAMMAEELDMKGLHFYAKSFVNLMKNQDKLTEIMQRGRKKAPVKIKWVYDNNTFTHRGYISDKVLFDIQQTKSGSILYEAGGIKLEQEKNFNSVDEAKEFCEKYYLPQYN